MTIDIEATFKKFDGEYIKFERIENPPSRSPDIVAFLLLDKLVPCKADTNIIRAVERGQFYMLHLRSDIRKLADAASEADILMLVRCGVMYDEGAECLSMFA